MSATLFDMNNTGGDSIAFLGYGIVLAGTTGTNDLTTADGAIEAIVAYRER